MRLQDQKLKAVRVYATHSLKFDEDYSLDRLKYSQNAPDLFIIAPLVHFAKPLNVDVSCLSVPDYPEGLANAKNGVQISENGADGKPGLPKCRVEIKFLVLTFKLLMKINKNN